MWGGGSLYSEAPCVGWGGDSLYSEVPCLEEGVIVQ